MTTPLRYPVPWDLVGGLTPHLLHRTRESLERFVGAIVSRMDPPPLVLGDLPPLPRFVLVANHYQRPGLWILHTASALTQAIRDRYGPGDPPVRWVVTANWPRWRIGPWTIRNPGDLLLPRVAHALHCYPVAFAGADPGYTARSLRRILRDARHLDRPIGIFPEGVAGSAGRLAGPLPGAGRFLLHLAEQGLPVVPAAVSEQGRLIIRFGAALPPNSPDPAAAALAAIKELLVDVPAAIS